MTRVVLRHVILCKDFTNAQLHKYGHISWKVSVREGRQIVIKMWGALGDKDSGGSRISHRGGRGPRMGGRGPPRRLRFENFACQNERIWTRRGGRAPGAPPLDPPMKEEAFSHFGVSLSLSYQYTAMSSRLPPPESFQSCWYEKICWQVLLETICVYQISYFFRS